MTRTPQQSFRLSVIAARRCTLLARKRVAARDFSLAHLSLDLATLALKNAHKKLHELELLHKQRDGGLDSAEPAQLASESAAAPAPKENPGLTHAIKAAAEIPNGAPQGENP